MPSLPLLKETTIADRVMDLDRLPSGLRVDGNLALVLGSPALSGQVVYTAARNLFETRATKTPGGDYLLMFPTDTTQLPTAEYDWCHYGGHDHKVNDMVAFRSCDQGKTWQGPTVAFDIDYNQHGFVPLIPRGSKRIYAFGTQPVWDLFTTERGQGENAPIGYRYSDDDGHHWSEVRLIRPQNDPDFRGMSVMRMCETDSGAWVLGTHEGDWSYRPGVMSRQYVLRSEDQGRTWTLLPHPRHGGWRVPQYNRMDEGRPINLSGGEVYLMTRTCEGRLWATRSLDDGKTWEDPAPTPLVHPDAPPMLFHLADGKTLAAFHHNRHHDLNYVNLGDNLGMKDRSEIWVSLSSDGGRSWSVPRFVLANAAAPTLANGWFNWQCSYLDAFTDNGLLHLFVPHRWQRCLHLQLPETELTRLPTAPELQPGCRAATSCSN
ncbi:MAG: exo-alpha-sialidase [Armatimonadetes bacterium]|nr:exo-alpha-sialidase [Armatimonadota bacterium]